MTIKKTDSGWLVDIQPGGRGGRRYRKTFKTKAEGTRWEAHIRQKNVETPDWNPKPKDRRRLSNLIERWYLLHGKHLKDGKGRRSILDNLAEAIGNPQARDLTPKMFTEYRATRLETGISPNTANHELAYLRALFNELTNLGEWSEGNPITNVRQLKTDERELTFLTKTQIDALLKALKASRNKDVWKVAMVCLATGARWTEAETLRAEQVQQYRVTYWGTKNGRGRTVPISEELHDTIRTTEEGRLFKPGYQAFQRAVERAGIKLPAGQMTHVLRHSFASHFMMNGGSILALQRILGHQSLTMTMRYAHLAPEHLEEAKKLNPVAGAEYLGKPKKGSGA